MALPARVAATYVLALSRACRDETGAACGPTIDKCRQDLVKTLAGLDGLPGVQSRLALVQRYAIGLISAARSFRGIVTDQRSQRAEETMTTTRKTILDIAETISRREVDLASTSDEESLIEQGQANFAHGRTSSSEQFETRSADFLKRLRDKAANRS